MEQCSLRMTEAGEFYMGPPWKIAGLSNHSRHFIFLVFSLPKYACISERMDRAAVTEGLRNRKGMGQRSSFLLNHSRIVVHIIHSFNRFAFDYSSDSQFRGKHNRQGSCVFHSSRRDGK